MRESSTPPRFRKTWGPNFVGEDTCRFRLWAPDERGVDLVLDGTPREMRQSDGGWFEITVEAKPGARYCFRLADGTEVADPASSAQERGAEGASLVVDQAAYEWRAASWRGRPWEEAVISELHIGCFTPEGTFRAAINRLPHLASAGITAIEIMPVAQFPGARGWGYDGVLHYAPHNAYGTPDDLKGLVDAAHSLGLMVLLDVVYNHFGPEQNYLSLYASRFFNKDRPTPWGASIAFEEEAVRRYFIENALYWLGDFRFDGLRLDATEQIRDTSNPHFLVALEHEVRKCFADRQVHLVVEDANRRRSLLERDANGTPMLFDAGWNDDLHNALHVVATGETRGHYRPFAEAPWSKIRSALAEGFAVPAKEDNFSAEGSRARVPPQGRVNFLQNHDQIGNRAFGERLALLVREDSLRVLTAMHMLAPQIPLLFMGEEYGETQPFYFFSDYQGEIADAIRLGRRDEAENFGGLPNGKTVEDLPDPLDPEVFSSSKLRWSRAASPAGERRLAYMRDLAAIRQRHIVPMMAGTAMPERRAFETEDGVIAVDWQFGESCLEMRVNLSQETHAIPPFRGQPIFASEAAGERTPDVTELAGPGIVVAIAR
ncbi:malto-oligosyltrehalose trehalohydrolase [Sinorhizobium medicae]|uniref:Malto-oligosyltrehalose trehalohydrolase n=1 Tax=Sinorhizobium medicae TaxID=110321 RepID=A0ABX4TQ21_9HYPH|nr:malto-oligosyltrehalose trehalohydrolase [Sinorhizobium medicae]MBO1941495.1 malto-oligosyltrehalose trehalohydrolase [Sinorhizobium medicae]MBO1961923.1 malto-oligosyltrehalose trehalohydrolase [Sinorhizobium medicae]MDX0452304.1 malto-oligosyltrehalose trehalohydrolase [Sinorhizobium medicae]MDX0692553.1 malto-oligosyltrehalose trehalohydrolase [Sinorhizobium medicae]MDX0711966.1 malto-oligosyltrehalose trehalohydrolase [Sinorhizobium medicae]